MTEFSTDDDTKPACEQPVVAALVLKHKRWSQLSVATLQLPDGQVTERDIEDHGAAVAVLPYDPAARTALLVRQFRTPPFLVTGEGMMLELPAGRLDEDDPMACARREALEEIGVRLGDLTHVVTVWTMPALSTERAHLYLASYRAADRVALGGGLAEEHENIEVVEMKLSQLAIMAESGTLTELKLFTLVQTLRLRRPDLFQPLP